MIYSQWLCHSQPSFLSAGTTRSLHKLVGHCYEIGNVTFNLFSLMYFEVQDEIVHDGGGGGVSH